MPLLSLSRGCDVQLGCRARRDPHLPVLAVLLTQGIEELAEFLRVFPGRVLLWQHLTDPQHHLGADMEPQVPQCCLRHCPVALKGKRVRAMQPPWVPGVLPARDSPLPPSYQAGDVGRPQHLFVLDLDCVVNGKVVFLERQGRAWGQARGKVVGTSLPASA